MTTLTLAAGDVLRISGANGDSVRVTSRKTNPTTHTFNSADSASVHYGPFATDVEFTTDVLAGNPTWLIGTRAPKTSQVPQVDVRDWVASLDNATDRIKSATTIARALNEGSKAMALVDKFRTIAARSHAIPKRLEERADALAARLDTVEARGDQAFKGHEDFLTGVESGVAAAEDALAQLTNGAPTT